MPLYNKNKLAMLSPTTPPKGFVGKGKKPAIVKKDKSKLSGFAGFGKK